MGEIKVRHRQGDTTSVVSSVNSNVTRALTVRKPSKRQPKRRRTTVALNEPSESISHDQPGTSSVPAPPIQNIMNNLDRHWYPTLKRRMQDGSVNCLNFMAFRRHTFHQPAHWLHLALQRQRNGKLKNKIRKVQQPKNR